MTNSTRNLSKTGHRSKRWPAHRLALGAVFLFSIAATAPAGASSHMDAPLVTLDPAANTTDVYAFISQDAFGQKYLTTALGVYPFEQPGIGPNLFKFDDRVTYDIHVALDNTSIGQGKADLTYRFRFNTVFANNTTMQSYLGTVAPAAPGVFPDNQNLRQTYTVTLIDNRVTESTPPPGRRPPIPLPPPPVTPTSTVLGSGMVPPNNQGRVTNQYNQNDDGDQPAKLGALTSNDLDPYTKNTIFNLQRGHQVFAGQREDGFFVDVQSIFDREFTFGRDRNTPTKPYDSQSGFNIHMIVLNIPIGQLGGATMAGVYATTSRGDPLVQVGRQGNPLFCEILIAHVDKDRYNQTKPTDDAALFSKYANNPELASVLGTTPIRLPAAPDVPVTRLIYIPDLIKVDLTTPPARLAGSNGFHRLGAFGGDVLQSTVQDPLKLGGLIPGGWPNGRRFGDDVVNIALIAIGVAGPFGANDPNFNATRVNHNDTTYNRVFPYAGTPHNGRNINPSTPNQF